MKYLRINLPKDVKNLYPENDKTLLREIKDPNERRGRLCPWFRRLCIVKMSLPPTPKDRFIESARPQPEIQRDS